jgi:hypothetical protein
MFYKIGKMFSGSDHKGTFRFLVIGRAACSLSPSCNNKHCKGGLIIVGDRPIWAGKIGPFCGYDYLNDVHDPVFKEVKNET